MPRRPRIATGGIVYHVLNRRVGRLPLFQTRKDYEAFERVLREAYESSHVRILAYESSHVRILAYCLMPNHWHLLVWPRADDELSEVMRWITVTHTQRWHAQRQSAGTGPVYQGRFKSFPVQADEHFLMVARYVERNAQRPGLVARAEDWRWSSLWVRERGDAKQQAWLSTWPVDRPRSWVTRVNRAESAVELEDLRTSVNRGRPYGASAWQARTAKRLGLEATFRPRGRPRGS